jgi:hypothetical protein
MRDVLAHRLSLVATYAGALEFREDASPEKRAEAAGVIRAGIQQALDELREVISALRRTPMITPDRRPQPTAADVPRLIEECHSAGADVMVQGSLAELSGLSSMSGRTAYRLVQEGIDQRPQACTGTTGHSTRLGTGFSSAEAGQHVHACPALTRAPACGAHHFLDSCAHRSGKLFCANEPAQRQT